MKQIPHALSPRHRDRSTDQRTLLHMLVFLILHVFARCTPTHIVYFFCIFYFAVLVVLSFYIIRRYHVVPVVCASFRLSFTRAQTTLTKCQRFVFYITTIYVCKYAKMFAIIDIDRSTNFMTGNTQCFFRIMRRKRLQRFLDIKTLYIYICI